MTDNNETKERNNSSKVFIQTIIHYLETYNNFDVPFAVISEGH
jgi:hypothetical protein